MNILKFNQQNNTPLHNNTFFIIVAANDSSVASKAQANYICDGTNDQEEISAAINELPQNGGEVILMEGTFHCSGDINPKSFTTLRGLGENVTILNFNVNRTGIELISSNIGGGDHIIVANFTITGKGAIIVKTSHNKFNNITIYKVDNSMINAFFIDTNGQVLEDIEFKNCKAIDVNRTGFGIYDWTGTTGTAKNLRFINCQAINCGKYGQFYGFNYERKEAWVVGFDIAEDVYKIEDVLIEDCIAEGSWESGFHMEYLAIKKNVSFINCTSKDNGQKEKSGSKACTYCAGFLISGDTHLINCSSESNKYGFSLRGGGQEVINCKIHDVSYGIYIFDVINDKLTINSCTIAKADYPFYFFSSNSIPFKEVLIKNILVESNNLKNISSIYSIDHSVPNPDAISISGSLVEDSTKFLFFNYSIMAIFQSPA